MGEYAKRKSDGTEIKIGTCEAMYYLRYEDRDKVTAMPGSIDVSNSYSNKGLFWRLPFPDEDGVPVGEYQEYRRGLRLFSKDEEGRYNDFSDPSTIKDPGTIQFSNESGLLCNVKCYHGEQLPEASKDFKPCWNGKSWFFELGSAKSTNEGVKPVVHCRHCGQMWSYTWDEILPFIHDPKMKERLQVHVEQWEVANA